MTSKSKIVTVGLAPAWDILCRSQGIDWHEHKQIQQFTRPAGKALNVSRALAWIGRSSTAAGLWGQVDYQELLSDLAALKRLVKIKFTPVPGRTRQNITIADSSKNREMHLRAPNNLVSPAVLKQLSQDLSKIVTRSGICIFAGAMPDEYLSDILKLIKTCQARQAKIVVDTSGMALRAIIDLGGIFLIKPNVDELCELAGRYIPDTPTSLLKAARPLLGSVQNVLVSRGDKGAIIINENAAWQGKCTAGRKKIHTTVACGDYLLAGFLAGLTEKADPPFALRTAIKAATARAWAFADELTWPQAQRRIKVDVRKI